MITILRGSSGSGKSYVAYRLLEEYPNEPLFWPAQTWPNKNKAKPKIFGYVFPGDLFLVGSYTARVCGGMDCVSGGPKVQFEFMERAARKYKHVFAEALMAAVSKDSLWADLRDNLAGAPSLPIIAPTLNTPEDLSIQRIYDRNGGKAFNEGASRSNWRRVNRKMKDLEAMGFYTPYVAHETSYESVIALLRWGGWNPENEIERTVT